MSRETRRSRLKAKMGVRWFQRFRIVSRDRWKKMFVGDEIRTSHNTHRTRHGVTDLFLAERGVECLSGKTECWFFQGGPGRRTSVAGARELDPRHVVGRVCPRQKRHLGARSTTSKTASSTTSGFIGWRVSGMRPSPCDFLFRVNGSFVPRGGSAPTRDVPTDSDARSDVPLLITSYPRPQIVASEVKVARSHVSTPPITREMVDA